MTQTSKQAAKSVPAYLQIENRLRSEIHRGVWPVGAMLPSRRDLAKSYGVSSLTVDRAVTRLIAEGILRADDRRGTFVTVPAEQEAGAPAADRNTPSLDSFAVVRTPLAGVTSAQPVRTAAHPATIGIVASLHVSRTDHVELNNFWVRLILQSLEHAISEEGRSTHFVNRVQGGAGEPLLPLRIAIQSLVDEGVAAIAIIALDVDPQEVDDSLAAVNGSHIPVVCVTLGELSRPVPHLFYENRSAGYQAAEHLLRWGSKNILLLAPFMATWVKERIEGAQAAAEHAGLSQDIVHVFPRRVTAWIQEEDPELLGYAAGKAAIQEGLVRSGIICVNDGVAFGFVKAAAEAGLTPGTEFALVSFDDHPDARTAGITTMRPPMETLGKEAARLLQRALQGETTDLQVRLRSHLIPRRSTRPVSTP